MCICTVFLKGKLQIVLKNVFLKNYGGNQYLDYSRDNFRCHFECEVLPAKVRQICAKTDLCCSLGVVWGLFRARAT